MCVFVGFKGLYRGVTARILWSGLFGGIGFTCFETMKTILKVPE
jgi:hypothetical protein